LWGEAARVLYQVWEGRATEERCLEIHRLAVLGQENNIAVTLATGIAERWIARSRFREGVALCKTTLEIAETSTLLNQVGRCEVQLGEVESARKNHQKALSLCPGENSERAQTLANLAYTYLIQGKMEEATTLYQQSLQFNEGSGDVESKAGILHNLAVVYTHQGKVNEAIAIHQQLLQYLGEGKDSQSRATTLHQLAILYNTQGRVNEAIALHQESLQIYERGYNIQGKSASLHCLAIIYVNQGRRESIALFQESLQLKEQIGDVHGMAMTLQWLGGIAAYGQNDFDQALKYWQRSLEILEHLQSSEAENVRQLIADVQRMAAE
jgi:tetratricopeptide (TPR) repeat protein